MEETKKVLRKATSPQTNWHIGAKSVLLSAYFYFLRIQKIFLLFEVVRLFPRRRWPIMRELKETTTTRTSLNKWFNEQNNSCARTFLYISLPSSAKQQREMTKFHAVYGTWTRDRQFFAFSFWNCTPSLHIQPEQVFRAIGVLSRSRHSLISLAPFSASSSTLLKLPIASL